MSRLPAPSMSIAAPAECPHCKQVVSVAKRLYSTTHTVAMRRTADGFGVSLECDGSIWIACSRYAMPGYSSEAAWLFLGEICLYDLKEVPDMLKVAKAAYKQKTKEPLIYLRERMGKLHPVQKAA